jgi:ribosomal protein S18 acetylase RimI-like enzyme
MLTKFRKDLQTTLHRQGWLSAGRWLLRYLATVPYEHINFIVLARSLQDHPPVPLPPIPLTMRLATQADLPYLQALVLPSEYDYFVRRLEHGRLCFLAFLAENSRELVAYRWATTEIDPGIDALIMDLPPGSAYIDDVYTAPAQRRQNIQAALYSFCLQYFQDLGYEQFIAIIDVKNLASQALAQKRGYQPIGRASFLRILRTIVKPLTVSLSEQA